jgi:transposase-like protein
MVMAAGLRRALKGLSEAAFRERFGTEEACRKALFEMRWRQGLSCPGCGHRGFCRLKTRELFQCNRCKRQVRLTAGTVFQDTKLPLTTWFAAIYHLTQSKNGISSIELGRRLGVKRQTAWLMKHKLMRAMGAREAHKPSSKAGSRSMMLISAASGRAASAAGVLRASSPSWPRSRPRPSAGPSGCG